METVNPKCECGFGDGCDCRCDDSTPMFFLEGHGSEDNEPEPMQEIIQRLYIDRWIAESKSRPRPTGRQPGYQHRLFQ